MLHSSARTESSCVSGSDWDIEFAHKSKPLPLPPQYAVEPFTRFVQPRTKEEQPKGNDVDRKRIWLPRPRVPIGKMDLSGTLLHKLDWADLETRDFVRVMVSPRFWKTSNRRGYYLEMMGIEVYGKFLIGTPKRKDPVQKMGTPKKGPMAIFSQLE